MFDSRVVMAEDESKKRDEESNEENSLVTSMNGEGVGQLEMVQRQKRMGLP